MLEKIRDTIKISPLNDNLLANVLNKMNSDTRFTSYRFRSSTNAEDLNGFNGAGLYSSYSGKLNHVKKTPQKAIKKVWASLWNFNAFEERDYFKINHYNLDKINYLKVALEIDGIDKLVNRINKI